jgi:hypothetical protein
MAKMGWVSGSGLGRKMKVGNTGAIESGDIVILDADAGSPYIMRATDDATAPLGVARDSCAAPTNDGDTEIFVFTDPNDTFRLPVATGTAAAAMEFDVCDIGVDGTTIGADVAASSYNLIFIEEVESTSVILGKIDFYKAGARTGAEA